MSTPVLKRTKFAPRITHRGAALTSAMECWEAEYGDWMFHREDGRGTQWLCYHIPSVADGSYTTPVSARSSIKECEKAADRGWLRADLEQRRGEDRARALRAKVA